MSDAVLAVLAAGPQVTIQDGGRQGLLRFGVPRSGPMDRFAFAAGNIALGNPAHAPGIEVSLGGLTLECVAGEVSFALAGGGFVVDHAGQPRPSWSIATLLPGERLVIRPGEWGSWCYLFFAGDLSTRRWLGSASTHAMSGLGGGSIAPGQRLVVGNAARRGPREGAIPVPAALRPAGEVRVVLGPQQRFFAPEAIASFLAARWHVSDARDRMGARLAGPSIAPAARLDMVSEPVVRGSVQVAADGVATVLLADHQTTGGYPKIATVLDCDLDRFVQRRPDEGFVFRPVTPAEAILLARSANGALAAHLAAIAHPRGSLMERMLSENLVDGVISAEAGPDD